MKAEKKEIPASNSKPSSKLSQSLGTLNQMDNISPWLAATSGRSKQELLMARG
jgi:hypothetical protein